MEVYNNQNSDNPPKAPRMTAAIAYLLNLGETEHKTVKAYLDQLQQHEEFLAEIAKNRKEAEKPAPEKHPLKMASVYNRFTEGFEVFRKKPFDEGANDGESGKLAKTLLYYFLGHSWFYQSPLLNHSSAPNLNKGLLIIGGYGCGKTSVMKTFHDMFTYAKTHGLAVEDVKGNTVSLGWYGYNFEYHTANDVVKKFDGLQDAGEREIFWKTMAYGTRYFDDLMTEGMGSNFGKVEVFKDILEMRYASKSRTLASLNYSGDSVQTTLRAINDKYGPRVYDRIFEMFNIIELKGESLRR